MLFICYTYYLYLKHNNLSTKLPSGLKGRWLSLLVRRGSIVAWNESTSTPSPSSTFASRFKMALMTPVTSLLEWNVTPWQVFHWDPNGLTTTCNRHGLSHCHSDEMFLSKPLSWNECVSVSIFCLPACWVVCVFVCFRNKLAVKFFDYWHTANLLL